MPLCLSHHAHHHHHLASCRRWCAWTLGPDRSPFHDPHNAGPARRCLLSGADL